MASGRPAHKRHSKEGWAPGSGVSCSGVLLGLLPVWNPKRSLDEGKPESTGEEKDWELRDQLQKETSQLQAKENEVRK